MSESAGGRIFFSNVRRSLEFEDQIVLVSVGVDIGSSTSHLVFSRLVLERTDNRYIVSERVVLHESEVLLTPYTDDQSIDAAALRVFVDRQYALAEVTPEQIDSGALILTGVAMRRSNARAIGELFAREAGKFVSVSAGDALETTLAAFGSGAAAMSIRDAARVMNVDIGGGTSKIAVCEAGAVVEQSAIDIGARIVAMDAQGRVERIEAAALAVAKEAGIRLVAGEIPAPDDLEQLVEVMAEHLFEAMLGGDEVSAETAALLRLDPLSGTRPPDVVCFSGGVAEYISGREARNFGDLGGLLARAIVARVHGSGARMATAAQGIRATVVGASQYTVQVSGATIFVEPHETLPLRNVAVIAPALPLADEELDVSAIADAIAGALRRMDLHTGERPVAVCYRWQGSATYARLHAFCQGMLKGMAPVLEQGLPLVLVGEGDIGGLVGLHCHAELQLANPVVSIDGIVLQEFDFIDIGALMDTSGAVPVVIKSLVFPNSAALGRGNA
ncbi:MAG: reactivating factor for ethanolamine ammonia lyase [Ramlibacter sp.]|nr:reactivating factor for ethanolamine ammonia lyase [Ramlibacter sp.]